MHIRQFTFGLFQTNTYVVSDDRGHVLLIDPACSTPYEQQMLLRYIEQLTADSQQPIAILATHGHLDHLWGAKWATEQWGVPVQMHPADIPMAQAMQQQYDLFGINMTAEPFPIVPLTEYRPFATLTDRIQTNNDLTGVNQSVSETVCQCNGLKLIHTPGHTPGSICLYWPEEKMLLSGDTLFCMGYGRTDLPGGNYMQLIDSLERLFELPADVTVYPGHGEPTTIGAERR